MGRIITLIRTRTSIFINQLNTKLCTIAANNNFARVQKMLNDLKQVKMSKNLELVDDSHFLCKWICKRLKLKKIKSLFETDFVFFFN